MLNELTANEKRRYSRQIILPEIGAEGQARLKAARVLVVGAGGLGCPVLTYLTAAGVGNIGIVDSDRVEISNLHRQVLFGEAEIGRMKAEAAVDKLQNLNPIVNFKSYSLLLAPKNALSLIENYDLVVDASDNFPTRYLINDACVILDKPFVLGSIHRFQGQVAVLNYGKAGQEKGPSYRCLFPKPPAPETVPNCSEIGVIGILPGIIGSLQANEVIKMIVGYGKILSGEILFVDSLGLRFRTLKISRNSAIIEQTLRLKENLPEFDYDAFCSESRTGGEIEHISVRELQRELENNGELQLVDIREPFGLEGKIPGSESIPLSSFGQHLDQISREKKVVIYCYHGNDSQAVIRFLQKEYGYRNLVNLRGGYAAWRNAADLGGTE